MNKFKSALEQIDMMMEGMFLVFIFLSQIMGIFIMVFVLMITLPIWLPFYAIYYKKKQIEEKSK